MSIVCSIDEKNFPFGPSFSTSAGAKAPGNVASTGLLAFGPPKSVVNHPGSRVFILTPVSFNFTEISSVSLFTAHFEAP